MKKITLALAALSFVACSSSSSTDNGATNALSQTFPTDLAVTSPFATGNAVEGLVKLSTFGQANASTTLDPPTFDSQKQLIQDRIGATDINKCGFKIRLFTGTRSVSCYGPNLDYTAHPDFVDGPLPNVCPVTNPQTQECKDGQLPSGDVGIWTENETFTTPTGDVTEACVASKVNSLVAEGQAQVDMAVNLVTAMLCAANAKAEDALPDVGESKDFKAALTEALGAEFTVNSATQTAESATDGTAYSSAINATASFDVNGKTKSTTIDLHLKHIVTDSTNGLYKGRLWYTLSGDVPSQPGGCPGGNPSQVGVSILYDKTGSKLIYRMQRAGFCSSVTDIFDAKNNLNPATWANNYNDVVMNVDPTDGSGVFSFAWQAGSNDSNTRVFMAELNPGSSGLSGCGYFGFGPKASSVDVGKISGMICNWAGPGNQHNPNTSVQRQCVKYDSTTKHFVTDTSIPLKITYSPTNSCDSTPTNPNGSFTYGVPGGLVISGGFFPTDLATISDLQADITPPTKPADI